MSNRQNVNNPATSKIEAFVRSAEKHPKAAQFALQAVARELLGDSRLNICCRYHVPDKDVEIWHKTDGERKTAYYTGLMRCGMGWVCPLCSARLSEKRRIELGAALDNARVLFLPVMVTYTVQHSPANGLKALLWGINDAYRKMRQQRLWRTLKEEYLIVGECRTVEITWSKTTGWHPHFHVLMFLDLAILKIIEDQVYPQDTEGHYEKDDQGKLFHYGSGQYNMDRFYEGLRNQLTPLWIESLAKVGLTAQLGPGLHVRGDHDQLDDYLTKAGTALPRASDGWGVKEEMTKAQRKRSRGDGMNVWDLLLYHHFIGFPYGGKFLEYYHATKGKSMMQWTPGMLKKLGIDQASDETVLADDPEPGDLLLIRLPRETWAKVLDAGAEGALLDVAQLGDWEQVIAFLDKIGALVPELTE